MTKKRVLFVLSQVLGHKTFSKNIIECVDRMAGIEKTVIYFDVSDYAKFRDWRKYNLWKNKFESAYTIKNKLKDIDISQFDLIFVLGYEFMYGLKNIIKNKPTILCTDTTDIQSHKLVSNNDRSMFSNAKRIFKDTIGYAIYTQTIRNLAGFAPMSEWCAESFRSDYNVSKNKLTVLYGGLNTNIWAPGNKTKVNDIPNLLFVTNDFIGKGGDLLMDAYKTSLRGKCTVTIVSNDPIVCHLKLPSGVSVKSGLNHDKLEELIETYRGSDIFVFPTKNDKLPNVLKEAAAVGLPLIAADVAGIKEIVRHGFNGFLLSHSSDANDWVAAISKLIDNPSLMHEFGNNSRQLACELFSMEAMEKQLEQIFNTVMSTRVR